MEVWGHGGWWEVDSHTLQTKSWNKWNFSQTLSIKFVSLFSFLPSVACKVYKCKKRRTWRCEQKTGPIWLKLDQMSKKPCSRNAEKKKKVLRFTNFWKTRANVTQLQCIKLNLSRYSTLGQDTREHSLAGAESHRTASAGSWAAWPACRAPRAPAAASRPTPRRARTRPPAAPPPPPTSATSCGGLGLQGGRGFMYQCVMHK